MSPMVRHGPLPPLSWPALSQSQCRAPPVLTAVLRAFSPFCSALFSSFWPCSHCHPHGRLDPGCSAQESLHRWDRTAPRTLCLPVGGPCWPGFPRPCAGHQESVCACVSWGSPPCCEFPGGTRVRRVPLGTREWGVPCFPNIPEAGAAPSGKGLPGGTTPARAAGTLPTAHPPTPGSPEWLPSPRASL